MSFGEGRREHFAILKKRHLEDEIIPLFNLTGDIAERIVFFDQKIGGIGYLKELSDANEIGDYVKGWFHINVSKSSF